MAKGQKKTNREAKKPKKTDAERQKSNQTAAGAAFARLAEKDPPRKG